MSKLTIQVQFPEQATPDLMHRAMNCIEDVFREAENKSIGNVSDIDHYSHGIFIFEVDSKRNLGEAMSIVKRQLRRHNLLDAAVVWTK